MNNLKKEIAKEIGETTNSKHKVWQRLQQQSLKKHNRMPLKVAVATVFVAAFLMLIILNPTMPTKRVAEEVKKEPVVTHGDGKRALAFEYKQSAETYYPYLLNNEGVWIAHDEYEFNKYNAAFKFNEIDIDYATEMAVFVGHSGGGCGQVVDQFLIDETVLMLKLDLPEDLRQQKELACPAVLQYYLDLFVVEREKVTRTEFLEGNKARYAPFDDPYYDEKKYTFYPIDLDHQNVERVKIINLASHDEKTIINKDTLNTIVSELWQAKRISGILNISQTATHRMIFTNGNDEQLIIDLWMNSSNEEIMVQVDRNTQTMYTINAEVAASIIN